jgi:hypothetical protein
VTRPAASDAEPRLFPVAVRVCGNCRAPAELHDDGPRHEPIAGWGPRGEAYARFLAPQDHARSRASGHAAGVLRREPRPRSEGRYGAGACLPRQSPHEPAEPNSLSYADCRESDPTHSRAASTRVSHNPNKHARRGLTTLDFHLTNE